MKDQQQHQLMVAANVLPIITERQSRTKGRWYAAFDVLVWLNTLTAFSKELHLELRYEDDKGAHQGLIDRCGFSNNPQLLLSNCASLAFVGRVSKAQLWITSEAIFKVSVLESKMSAASVSADQYLNKVA